MTAETEISKEVVVIEEKSGLEKSSCQDLPKPNCNGISNGDQVNDSDNSYVFVTGVNGISVDPVLTEKESVVDEGSVVEPDAVVEVNNGESDVVDGEVSESLKEEENGNVEGSDLDPLVINSDGTLPEQEESPDDGDGIQVAVTGASGEQNGETESREAEINEVEDPSVRLESSPGDDTEKVSVQEENLEKVAEVGIGQVEDSIGIDCSAGDEVEAVENQIGNFNVVSEIKQEKIEDQIISESSPAPVENLEFQVVPESEEKGEVINEKDESEVQNNVETETSEVCLGSQNVVADAVESEFQEVRTEGQQRMNTETSIGIDCSAGDEVVAVENQIGNFNVVSEIKQEKIEDQIKSESSPAPVENLEFQVVPESEEKGEVINEKDESEVQNNVETETSEVCLGSQNVVADAVVSEFQEVRTEGQQRMNTETSIGIDCSAGDEVEAVENQIGNFNVISEIKQEKIEDQIKSESSPAPVENLEFQVVPESEEKGEVINEKDECEVQNNVDTETSELCLGSQNVVADAVESEFQEVKTEGQNEVKLVREAVEMAEHEGPLTTSVDSALHSNPTNNAEENLEEEAPPLGSEVTENPKCDTASINNVQDELEQVDEVKTVVDCDNMHVEIVCDLVLEEKNNEDISISCVDDSVQYVEEPEKHSDDNEVSPEIMQSQSKPEASLPTQSLPASAREPEIETNISGAKTVEMDSSSPMDSPTSEIVENGPYGLESSMNCTKDDVSSGSDSVLDAVVCTEKEPTSQGGDPAEEIDVSIEKTKVVSSPPPETANVKLDSEVPDSSAASSEEISTDVTVTSRKDVLDCSDVSNKGVSNSMLETTDVKDMGDQLDSVTGSADENLFVQENGATGNSWSDSISMDSPTGSSTALISGEETSFTAVTKPFNYLIRIPRFNDESLKEQIRVAKLNLDEKTKLREAIQVQIREIRANNQIYGVDYESTKGENRSARQLVRSKRMEIDSLLPMINKAKNATSIEDIDKRIYSMEHMMQHETLNLKEEKQFIREIKQLKQLREQLSSNMDSQDDIKQAVEQKEQVEERLKTLRKELEILKKKVLTTEATFVEADKKNNEENKKVKELQAQYRAADDVRQEAYVRWQSLKKELWQKNQHFYKYKDDAAAANNFAFSRDRGALYSLCMNQVENFMELWNTNKEFRKEYVSANTRSTVRRLGTLDGRSLGPDEEPPILPSYVNDRVNKMVSTPAKVNSISQSQPELKLETSVENGTVDDKSIKKVTEQKNHKGAAAKSVATISGRSASDEVEGPPVKSKEEIELAMKAEEMRKREAEAKLNEQRRLEELAKANEARERKKRQAEKVQKRAELKAQKEAEEKEREREKRLKKKERKKATATDATNDNTNNSDYSGPSSETAIETTTGKEIEAKETSSAVPVRSKKAKQSQKTKPIPPPLRNRNRKKLQQYAWAALACIIAIFFFWMGNIGFYFPNVNSKK